MPTSREDVLEVRFKSELSSHERKCWDAFWHACAHAYPRQHSLFGEVEKAQGRTVTYVSGAIGPELKCIGVFSTKPLFIRDRFSYEAYCLRGPAFDDPSVLKIYLERVLEKFSALNTGTVRIAPYWLSSEAIPVVGALAQLGFRPCDSRRQWLETGRIDLLRSEEELLASLSQKTRKHMRNAQNLGVEILPVTNLTDAMKGFDCLREMRRKRGLPPMPQREFEATFDQVLKGQDFGILYNAHSNGLYLGSIWLLRNSRVALPVGYVLNHEACHAVSKHTSFGLLLWWEGIRWAKSRGCAWLDVEGYSERMPPTDSRYNFHSFKGKFRPQSVQIIDEHQYVCSVATYAASRCARILERVLSILVSLPYQLWKLALLTRGRRGEFE